MDLLQRYVCRELTLETLLSRGIYMIEVSVAEAPSQSATFRCTLPQSMEELDILERSHLCTPAPCKIFDVDA